MRTESRNCGSCERKPLISSCNWLQKVGHEMWRQLWMENLPTYTGIQNFNCNLHFRVEWSPVSLYLPWCTYKLFSFGITQVWNLHWALKVIQMVFSQFRQSDSIYYINRPWLKWNCYKIWPTMSPSAPMLYKLLLANYFWSFYLRSIYFSI